MDCQTLKPLIDQYLARDLPAATHAEVAAHLTTCAPCRARVHDAALLDGLLADMPRETVSSMLVRSIQQAVRHRSLRRRIGHALPIAIATALSGFIFLWLAGETWLALQDRALWEVIGWFISVPDLIWQQPADVLAGIADFAPIGGVLFTFGSAATSCWLAIRLVKELRNPVPRHSIQ
jgi:predicted anti-sigma-YlaC factor YlaD